MPKSAVDDINEPVWLNPEVVREYTDAHQIQVPEAAFFAKYADRIRNCRVLDLGCGAGRTTRVLRHLTGQYLGTDVSPVMVEEARGRFPGVKFETVDARDLSRFEPGSFDFALFSYNGLDCVDHEGRLLALAAIRRALKPGGIFVFSSHNRKYPALKPRLMKCVNPFTFVKNAALYTRQKRQWSRLRRFEVHTEEYEIRNDAAHDFGLMLYAIDKENQVNQAGRFGLRVLEMMDTEGRVLRAGDDDRGACWIYYAAEAV